ncbi:SsgA family sporulation/cell division regulator [Rhodococcus antarcticus]|jgi:hypothetical protein|uniref:SsgA family sporulation/cell division regulator n=1 Tax=Rhodococcus antarcticus TaxID=2987751 RepID=A0ABY6P344_9NOCA|nr:SsgA family sporulation/cell division regulator [Rhodococcus antarcticus]UZJ26084.1 SsgA family sporulation/cell division regulator [Rhodococcus antarcticus]
MKDSRTVVASAVFRLLGPPSLGTDVVAPRWSSSVPVPAQLRFSVVDPFAVHLRLTTGPARDVRWVFARELLTEGLLAPTGDGDVRVWPCADGTRDVVLLELSSPSGHACFEASATEVAAFLDRSFAVVAPGRESEQVDLDAALAALLTPGAR